MNKQEFIRAYEDHEIIQYYASGMGILEEGWYEAVIDSIHGEGENWFANLRIPGYNDVLQITTPYLEKRTRPILTRVYLVLKIKANVQKVKNVIKEYRDDTIVTLLAVGQTPADQIKKNDTEKELYFYEYIFYFEGRCYSLADFLKLLESHHINVRA